MNTLSIRNLFFLVTMLTFLSFLCSSASAHVVEDKPLISVSQYRSGVGGSSTLSIRTEEVPSDINQFEFKLDLRNENFDVTNGELPRVLLSKATLDWTQQGNLLHINLKRIDEAVALNGTLMEFTIKAPSSIVQRKVIRIEEFQATKMDGTLVYMNGFQRELETVAVSLISEPVAIAAYLAGVVGLVYWLSTIASLGTFFRFLPPLIWMYFIPMVSTTIGITPDSSPFYSPFMSRFMLPAILILLLIPSDITGLKKLGGKAVFMLLFGSFGICLGAIVSFWIFVTFMPSYIPEDAWKGIAALAGSWIGGSPNMTAVLESVGTPPGLIGPLIVVDTVLAYSWLGILIALSAYQNRIDKKFKADTTAIEELSVHLEEEQEANARRPMVLDIAIMLGIAMVASQICMNLGKPIFGFISGIDSGLTKGISQVVNASGWGYLLVTAVGLYLSTTKVRHLDYAGASSIGYVGLYLLLTTYGARADLRAIFEVPIFFGIGFVWLLIHIAFLILGMWILKAPLFLAATSSMANIGGTASAPVVAASYNQSMAPVGLLMAILGGTLGTPLALFVVATACRLIQGGHGH